MEKLYLCSIKIFTYTYTYTYDMNQDVYQMQFVASKIFVEWNDQRIILSRNARISSNPDIPKFFGYFYSFILFIIVVSVVWIIITLNKPETPCYELYVVKFMIILGLLFLQFCFYYILGWFLLNRHKLILTPSSLIYYHDIVGTGFQGVYRTIPLKDIRSVKGIRRNIDSGLGILFKTDNESLYTFHIWRAKRSKNLTRDELYYKNEKEEYIILVNLIEDFLIRNDVRLSTPHT
jgi:hypothetical protein